MRAIIKKRWARRAICLKNWSVDFRLYRVFQFCFHIKFLSPNFRIIKHIFSHAINNIKPRNKYLHREYFSPPRAILFPENIHKSVKECKLWGLKGLTPSCTLETKNFERGGGRRKERKEEGGTEMRTTRGIINLTQGMEFRDKISLKFSLKLAVGPPSSCLLSLGGKNARAVTFFQVKYWNNRWKHDLHREKLWPPFSKLNKSLDEASSQDSICTIIYISSSYIVLYFLTMGSNWKNISIVLKNFSWKFIEKMILTLILPSQSVSLESPKYPFNNKSSYQIHIHRSHEKKRVRMTNLEIGEI